MSCKAVNTENPLLIQKSCYRCPVLFYKLPMLAFSSDADHQTDSDLMLIVTMHSIVGVADACSANFQSFFPTLLIHADQTCIPFFLARTWWGREATGPFQSSTQPFCMFRCRLQRRWSTSTSPAGYLAKPWSPLLTAMVSMCKLV